MKITCTRGVMASGKALEAGQTYDVSDKDGALLITMGKAVEAVAEEPKPKRTRKPKTDGAS
tara:strand:- start:13 stop:195 length:183 start_codon:yes stop_codon:yes gene_type:complete